MSKPRPLAERLAQPSVLHSDSTARTTPAFAMPVFTRLGLDAKVPPAVANALERARAEQGLTIYGECIAVAPVENAIGLGGASGLGGANIVPIAVDEPLLPRSIRSAHQIEFQFMPAPAARAKHGMARSDWAPTLPSDLATATQLTRRVELVRQMCEDPNALVGGAIAAAAVEDDLRYLIDCGLDYACVLADACYGMQPAERIAFADPLRVIEQSISTIQASGQSKFSLLVAAANVAPESALRWMGMGVRAVGIDGWLQSKCPPTPVRSSDGFGGFLVDVARPSDRASEWLSDAVRDFLNELASELSFAGYQSL